MYRGFILPPAPVPTDKFCGFTPGEIFRLKYLIDVMDYTGRVEDFVQDAIGKGIPSQREQMIAYHQKKIEELKKG
jgi:hypothetical protein